MLDPVVPDILGGLYDAVLQLPGVRLVMGLASPNWRPLWALTWAVGLVYLAVRALESMRRAGLYRHLGTQPAARAPRPMAPPGAELPSEPELVEAAADNPAPAPPAAPDRPGRPTLAMRAAVGTAALGSVLLLLELFDGAAPERVQVTSSPVEGGAEPGAPVSGDTLTDAAAATPAAPFTFAARGWRTVGGACVATLEVTGAAQPAGSLTMYVMGAGGTVLGTATLRVPSLTRGAFHEFRFPGVDCDAVTEWQVQG